MSVETENTKEWRCWPGSEKIAARGNNRKGRWRFCAGVGGSRDERTTDAGIAGRRTADRGQGGRGPLNGWHGSESANGPRCRDVGRREIETCKLGKKEVVDGVDYSRPGGEEEEGGVVMWF